MNNDQILAAVAAILFKTKVITGWNVPDKREEVMVLYEQLSLFLKESYPTLNEDEMVYVMRNYATSINNWGKDINLSLLNGAIKEYSAAREEASKYEEGKVKAIEHKPTPEQVMNMRREVIETNYQSYLQGKQKTNFLSEDGIDTLVNDGFCEIGLEDDFIKTAWAHLHRSYTVKLQSAFNANEVKELRERQANLINDDNVEVKIMSRKMAQLFCFKKFKEAGYKNIYQSRAYN